jgi:hypothetical protein
MDPVTAINNGITAFFSFLATPQGQLVVADLRGLNANLSKQINDLFNHLHASAMK